MQTQFNLFETFENANIPLSSTQPKRKQVFKTSALPSDQIKKIEFGAKSQETKILAYLQANSNEAFVASELYQWVFVDTDTPTKITSVRRALWVLWDAGKIIKLDDRRLSELGSGVSEIQYQIKK